MAEKTDITSETPPEQIRQDIARTREEMSSTVDEIQERLSPQHLKEHARESIRESAADKMNRMKAAASRIGRNFGRSAKQQGSTVADAVGSNPVPIAMIGAGIAWFLFSRTRTARTISEQGSSLKEQARARAGEVSGQVREAGSGLAGRASRSAEQIGSSAREQARSAGSRFRQLVERNPLSVAVWGFGIGALLGFSIPESRKEQEMMGSASETLLTRAKETAQKTLQKAQHAAESAAHAAGEELKKSAA